MSDWNKVQDITGSCKGFVLPPPDDMESAQDYYYGVRDSIFKLYEAIASIHAIAYRHVQNLPQPIRQEGEPSCEGKENSPIREEDGERIENHP